MRRVGARGVTVTRARILVITAAFGLMMLGNGLMLTLVGVRSTRADFGGVVTGAVLGMYYVGFLLGARHAPAILQRFGVTRSLAMFFLAMGVICAAPALGEVAVWWIVLRLLQGYAISAAYVVMEAFLNAAVPNERRGRLLGFYMVVTMAAYGAGTYAIDVVGSSGAWPFVVGGLFNLAAALSLVGTRAVLPSGRPSVLHAELPAVTPDHLRPAPANDAHLTLRQLYALAPLGVVVGVVVGVTNGGITGTSVYAEAASLTDRQTGLLGLVGAMGPLLILYPMSAMSDRLPRRWVLGVCAAGSATLLALNTLARPGSVWMLALVFVIGGLTVSQYTLTSAETNDHVRPDQVGSVGSHVIVIYGVGALFGTVTVSIATSIATDWFWWMNAVGHLGVLAVVGFVGRGQPRGRAIRHAPADTSSIQLTHS